MFDLKPLHDPTDHIFFKVLLLLTTHCDRTKNWREVRLQILHLSPCFSVFRSKKISLHCQGCVCNWACLEKAYFGKFGLFEL